MLSGSDAERLIRTYRTMVRRMRRDLNSGKVGWLGANQQVEAARTAVEAAIEVMEAGPRRPPKRRRAAVGEEP